MEFEHRPVLLEPTVDALLQADFGGRGASRTRPRDEAAAESRRAGGTFVDGTFGRGGHSRELLSRLGPQARLVVFDKDPQAIAVAQALAAEDGRVQVVHGGFATMAEALMDRGIEQVDGVMLDLGVSSPQIDDAQRGFSFMRDGPLDMRMDTSRGPTVAEWLAQASVEEMREVIADYGEERFAFQVAKAIAARCATRPLRTTLELAECVASAVRTREKGQHPATRTFQALRIYINRELEELARALASAIELLAPGGRLAVISFHSLEDRMVKQCIAAAARPAAAHPRLPLRESELPQPILQSLGKVVADDEEVAGNARSRSAILRAAERTAQSLPADGAAGFVPAVPGAAPAAKGRRR
ncbi:16S rRNA (cytosine(1402)-N(4))-methyltransferase RsmH [Bordetella holmesii]|uniref:Ribosomal RNA small subunit methyltransferase H n=2 Tax=Bordetella holmesii TaxID=35814 RepID=A0A158M9L5_9BORD|nr:16S rRNA (cytosine(1402)-N(4))-methyltransferase RsmH [Bordetella holmesii]AHV92749.1 16S rRNA (cytosine(1402)-N(4))-methyltransferase [Bordetella holmesii ATCC 51541]EWM43980.1 16S rRNA (cytosine(1402)-N(4))-methyltransferase [Bordetella holmesii 41130]AMD45749.1 ribosomal RNA small subunit methyltransferase H [Bordetella holmesii H558]AMD48832.1 16S rRNA methyltransferase [Bordetella holmesii F627]AOB34637.1 16S rRNA (cytosine(1402)-N(4))-methyltransferase [Bordetella holmesii]